MPRLSAIIIALNEAGNIADCLDTLSFCDERIVVDGGSTDATAQIAQDKGARVISHPFEGFGAQKGFALSLATGDWVLSIDADERVSVALAQEIRGAIAAGEADCYELPRRSSFCAELSREIFTSCCVMVEPPCATPPASTLAKSARMVERRLKPLWR